MSTLMTNTEFSHSKGSLLFPLGILYACMNTRGRKHLIDNELLSIYFNQLQNFRGRAALNAGLSVGGLCGISALH